MLSPTGELVRRHDPDRFLTTLFAPADRRDALWTLYAFNHELARAREVASEPILTLIRLQWWREVAEGAARRRHAVATPVSDAIARGDLVKDDLLAMIEAREMEADPSIPSSGEFMRYVHGAAGGVAVAAARLLGAPEPELFRPFGTAYGIAGILRSVPRLAAQGRCLFPEDHLAVYGLSQDDVIARPAATELRPLLHDLAAEGIGLLRRGAGGGKIPKSAVAAGLVAVLASRDLRRVNHFFHRPRGVGDRIAVTLAAWRGKPSGLH